MESFASPEASTKKRFTVFPGIKGLSPQDPEFLKYAELVSRALESCGFSRASDFQNADLAILASYYIGKPMEFTKTINTRNTITTRYSDPTSPDLSRGGTYFGGLRGGTDSRQIPGQNFDPKNNRSTIESTQQITATVHVGELCIQGVDLLAYRTEGKVIEIWKTRVTGVSPVADLDRIFPAMLVAASPHLATNLPQPVSVAVRDDDPRVVAMRPTASTPQPAQAKQ